MRKILITNECNEFVERHEKYIKTKFLYLIQILKEQRIVNTKFVKKIINTKFYELRIKSKNEYRVLIISIDHENFNESEKIVLLNGFLKKNLNDYKKAIREAEKLIEKYEID